MVELRICLRICNQAKIEELFNKGADDDVIKMLPGVSMWWVNKAQFKVGGTLRSWPSNHATKSSGWNLNKQICPLFSFQNNQSFKVSEFSSLISNTATLASKRFLEINKVYKIFWAHKTKFECLAETSIPQTSWPLYLIT